MSFDRVFITGCGGMLGNAIYPYFLERYRKILAVDIQIEEHEETWLKYCDVRERSQLERVFRDFKPQLVLHLAALVDVETCEDDPDDAVATHATSTKNVAELCKEYGSTMVYISTGRVFDGEKDGYYTEDDQPNPIMVYGQTKYDGEMFVRDILDTHYIVRPGWMVGGGPEVDHKFVKQILEQIAAGEPKIYGVDDKVGTPTYTHDFAMTLFELLNTKKYGTYHMVCKEAGTRFDVAKEIVKICGKGSVRNSVSIH
ncbi:MAG: NAD(P)-dependent oxidoreductase [Pseudomonadales bacterium]|nr:NAD(P)-dependent oxidoreductase [Pseudomonadales bacterium]